VFAQGVVVTAPETSHYPFPGEPVAYLCSEDACSLPIRERAELASALHAALAAETR
jgi:hypothetical protein